MLVEDCKVGADVIVARRAPGCWVSGMDSTIGMRGTIREVFEDGSGAQVSLPEDEEGWAYPAEALDPVGPSNCTLSPEEVADAQAEGVEVVGDPGGISYARRGGRWFWTESKAAFVSGLYDPKDGVFPVDGEEECAALDRVVDHWARVAEMDKAAAATAASLKDARAWAEAHTARLAEIIDMLPVDSAANKRTLMISMRMQIRDIDRLIQVYEAQADGSKP